MDEPNQLEATLDQLYLELTPFINQATVVEGFSRSQFFRILRLRWTRETVWLPTRSRYRRRTNLMMAKKLLWMLYSSDPELISQAHRALGEACNTRWVVI